MFDRCVAEGIETDDGWSIGPISAVRLTPGIWRRTRSGPIWSAIRGSSQWRR